MKLEAQVCSLKLSKQLKALGVEQKSLFYWVKTINGIMLVYEKDEDDRVNEHISAFTVAELGEGELLPYMIKIDGDPYFYCQGREGEDEEWQSNYENYKDKNKIFEYLLGPQEDGKYTYILERTEANARAKMLIYLIENKLIND